MFRISRAAWAGVLALLLFVVPAAAVPYISTDSHTDVEWITARVWLQSADCARETKAILVLCTPNGLLPLADADPGDDIGHALALDVYSALTGKAAIPSKILILNVVINWIGIVLLAATLLYAMNLATACFLLLVAGPLVAALFNEASPHPSQLGGAALATILPLVILGLLPLINNRRKRALTWLTIGLVSLSAATMFRQSIGLMGAVASILALAVVAIRSRRWLLTGTILFAIFVSYQSPYIILRARDAAYHLTPSKGMEQHGVWHNLYLGLGVVDNSFGITWDDTNALDLAHRVDPHIEYLSKQYFDVLRDEYFKIIRDHPFDVAAIYMKKLQLTLMQTTAWTGLAIWPVLLGLAIISIFLRGMLLRGERFGSADALLAVSVLYICFFIAQSMLFHFQMIYIFPIQLFQILWAGAALEFLLLLKHRSADLPIRVVGKHGNDICPAARDG